MRSTGKQPRDSHISCLFSVFKMLCPNLGHGTPLALRTCVIMSSCVLSSTPTGLGGLRRSAALARLIAIGLMLLAPARVDAAVAQLVQSGTAVNTANGIQTITISSVDTTKSVL